MPRKENDRLSIPMPINTTDRELKRLLCVEIDGEFKRRHGHRPRGLGRWQFRVGPMEEFNSAEVCKVGDEPLQYKTALNVAKDYAVAQGYAHVFIDPESEPLEANQLSTEED